jgi:hypothetical protein
MELQDIGDIYFIMLATKIKAPLYHINQFFRLIGTLMILNVSATR